MKYLKAFIDLDAVTLLVFSASEMKFYWDPKGTVNQTTSCQHTLSKKTGAAHRYGRVIIEITPVFYRGYKIWVLVLVRVIKSLVIAHRDKTRVQMFYFLNKIPVLVRLRAHSCFNYYASELVPIFYSAMFYLLTQLMCKRLLISLYHIQLEVCLSLTRSGLLL